MKVLHVIPSMSAARGGPTIVLRQLTAAQSSEGLTVHVATTDDDGSNKHIPVPHGIPIAEFGGTCFYFPRQTRFYSFSWPLTRWLFRHIRDYDIVHIHALFSYPSTATAWIARRAGIPYLLRPLGTLSQWGLASRRPLLKRLSLSLVETPMLRAAAAIQATSNQERIETEAACPECRVVVIPNPVPVPVDLPARSSLNRPSAILFLSRIDPKKGLEVLLPAFDLLAAGNPDVQLNIAGNGDPTYVASIHRLAMSLTSHKRIHFLGNVAGEKKKQLFADSDLFVLPSHSENFGVAVVEAMAHGVPVLISQEVGIHSEVTKAGAGNTTTRDPESISRAIADMFSQGKEELLRMGERGRRLAVESYAPDLVARRLISEYQAIIRREPSGLPQ